MKQKEYISENSIYKLKEILKKYRPRNIFLVTGKNSYEKCGAKRILDEILKDYKITYYKNDHLLLKNYQYKNLNY